MTVRKGNWRKDRWAIERVLLMARNDFYYGTRCRMPGDEMALARVKAWLQAAPKTLLRKKITKHTKSGV